MEPKGFPIPLAIHRPDGGCALRGVPLALVSCPGLMAVPRSGLGRRPRSQEPVPSLGVMPDPSGPRTSGPEPQRTPRWPNFGALSTHSILVQPGERQGLFTGKSTCAEAEIAVVTRSARILLAAPLG